MKIENFNNAVRGLITRLVEDGYKKKPICDVTLGTQSNPQFEGFLKGNDLGIKPLSRLIEGLGYQLTLVPVREDDLEGTQLSETSVQSFLKDVEQQLREYLDEKNATPRKSSPRKSEPSDIELSVNKILSDL